MTKAQRHADIEGTHAESWAERNGWQARAEIAERALQKWLQPELVRALGPSPLHTLAADAMVATRAVLVCEPAAKESKP